MGPGPASPIYRFALAAQFGQLEGLPAFKLQVDVKDLQVAGEKEGTLADNLNLI